MMTPKIREIPTLDATESSLEGLRGAHAGDGDEESDGAFIHSFGALFTPSTTL